MKNSYFVVEVLADWVAPDCRYWSADIQKFWSLSFATQYASEEKAENALLNLPEKERIYRFTIKKVFSL